MLFDSPGVRVPAKSGRVRRSPAWQIWLGESRRFIKRRRRTTSVALSAWAWRAEGVGGQVRARAAGETPGQSSPKSNDLLELKNPAPKSVDGIDAEDS